MQSDNHYICIIIVYTSRRQLGGRLVPESSPSQSTAQREFRNPVCSPLQPLRRILQFSKRSTETFWSTAIEWLHVARIETGTEAILMFSHWPPATTEGG
jgi:hypothetical protein